MDNSIKTNVSFLFESGISYQTVSIMMMAIRRSQMGYYSNFQSSKVTTRGTFSNSKIAKFSEGVIDLYQTYISSRFSPLQEEVYFYLKGCSFLFMFTHDKEGVGISFVLV